MSILNKLTLKHLQMNKKRTLVTIIGIILSTALMIGIGLLVSSLIMTERTDAEKNFGTYHLSIKGLTKENMSALNKNINLKEMYYYNPLGFAKVNSPYSSKPYLYVTASNKNFLNKLKIKEGRLPENSSELVISEDLNPDNSNPEYKVGNTITLELGTRMTEDGEAELSDNYALPRHWKEDEAIYETEELNIKTTKTYKIVGIVKERFSESYDSAGLMAFTNSDTPENDIYNAFLEFKKPTKTYEYLKEITKSFALSSSDIKANQNLLYYYGVSNYNNVNQTIIPLITIALSVISIGCIIVIYNSFAISTMERKKSFGLYASIGATMKQIRHTVFFEAFIVGFIGIILGLASGFLGIYILIKFLNYLLSGALSLEIIFSVEPIYIIIPLIFMVIVILASAYLPAKRSSKITPIEAIRGSDDIKISPKEIKTPKFITKLFGIEGTIAHKNIKRNKKKYRITIISLFISIVMFNTFTSFLQYVIKGSDAIDYYDFDLGINFYGDLETIKKDMKNIPSKYKIAKSLPILNADSVEVNNLKSSDFTNLYNNMANGISDNEKEISFGLIVLSDDDYAKISKEEALLLNKKYFTNYSNNNRKTIEVEVFTKKSYTLNMVHNKETVNLTAKTLDIVPYGLKNNLYTPNPILIISESTYQTKFKISEIMNARYLLSSDDYKKIYEDLKNKTLKFTSNIDYFSPAIDNANTKNLILAIKVLFYGFISLVTLIGVTSVINTINTNINLRRKEFAMLRSIGLTPKGFNKLLFFESLFFGLKSLIYGLPVSLAINFLISLSLNNVINTSMIIPWQSFIISIISVFIIVIISMNYASKKIKKENILEALREENI